MMNRSLPRTYYGDENKQKHGMSGFTKTVIIAYALFLIAIGVFAWLEVKDNLYIAPCLLLGELGSTVTGLFISVFFFTIPWALFCVFIWLSQNKKTVRVYKRQDTMSSVVGEYTDKAEVNVIARGKTWCKVEDVIEDKEVSGYMELSSIEDTDGKTVCRIAKKYRIGKIVTLVLLAVAIVVCLPLGLRHFIQSTASVTTDPANYFELDEGVEIPEDVRALFPAAIPENTENATYFYMDMKSGEYDYNEISLSVFMSEEDYAIEKERLIASQNGYEGEVADENMTCLLDRTEENVQTQIYYSDSHFGFFYGFRQQK